MDIKRIKLRRPSCQYARQVMDFRDELKKNGKEFDGCAGLEDCASFEEWIRFEERLKVRYKEGYVPSEVFLAVRETDDCLVGIIDYRHPLTDFLMSFGGNIGFSVRPSERRKGYASEMLRLMLDICRSYGEKRVLLTCDSDNTASRKTILKNGGVLENEIEDTLGLSKCGRIQRYWVSLVPMLEGTGTSIILETEGLFLREMDMNDYDALYQVLADTEIMRHYPYTFDEVRVRGWIERNMDRYRVNGFGLWAVCLKECGEMIGDCGLTLQNINGNVLPEIGYHIRRDCQRKGYAKEVAKAVRDWAFRNANYPALYSYCNHANEPSIRTAYSIGLHFDCEYPDEANGITHVSVISREDWLSEIAQKSKISKRKGFKMEYNSTVTLKDGRVCVLRNGTALDGQALLDEFNLTHEQTDYLLTYPGEHSYTAQQEADFLQEKTDSADEIELLAELDGIIVGSAGIGCVGHREKTRHRAEFGISVDKAYWGLGIGRALTEACIECAKKAGYAQLELEVVAENRSAIALYKSVGFVEYGRNPKGFRSRFTSWQEVVLMRLDFDIGE